MVRGRRVRAAVVACGAPQPDDCCSPNAKRKDKINMAKCVPNTNQPITNYFQAVIATQEPTDNITANMPNGNHNETQLFNGLEETKSIQTHIESIKSPATPHRIQLNDHHKTTKPLNEHSQQQEPDITPTFPVPQQPKARKKLLQSQLPNAPTSQQTHISSFFPSVRRSVRKTKTTVLEERQRSIEDSIRNMVEDGLTVREFAGKGRGVVAARHFERGDFVVEYSGQLIDMAEARCREAKYARDDRGCYMYYFSWKSKQYCIDATAESGRLGRLVNHSRTIANLCTRIVPVDGAPRLCLVARDAVMVGDELTYDYGDRSKESLQHHPWLAY